MIGQGKTAIQAEIDAAAELIDFFRFNAKYALELQHVQPISVPISTNTMVYRGLEVRDRGCSVGSFALNEAVIAIFLLYEDW
ncbi:hypothetical protein FKM82_013187 [Ascaphus truei]